MNLKSILGARRVGRIAFLAAAGLYLLGTAVQAAPPVKPSAAPALAAAQEQSTVTGTVEVLTRNLLGKVTRVQIRVSKTEAYEVDGGAASAQLLKMVGKKVSVSGVKSLGGKDHHHRITAAKIAAS